MSIIDNAPAIGSEPYQLPAITWPISPQLTQLLDLYHANYNSTEEDGADIADRLAAAIGGFPANGAGDLAVKLMMGLHYLHPVMVGEALAIDTEHFAINTAAEMLIGVMHDQIRAAEIPASDEFDRLYAEFATLKLFEDGLPANNDEQEKALVAATQCTDAVFDAMMAVKVVDPFRLGRKLNACRRTFDMLGSGLDQRIGEQLFIDIERALGVAVGDITA